MTIQPLDDIPLDPTLKALPKADLHLHQEAKARLATLLARRSDQPLLSRKSWAQKVLDEYPPGMGRLNAVYQPDTALNLDGALDRLDADPHIFIERVTDILVEGATDGAILLEVRFGSDELLRRPDFMALFREAERRAQVPYPQLCAEAVGYLNPVNEPGHLKQEEQRLEACLLAARAGLGGVDFRVDPYVTEADTALWEVAYSWAERAADAGLGVTVHAGEFSGANLAAALRMPGLGRIGHGVYAATSPRLMEMLAQSGATVECSLTCNVILGAVPSYEEHPISQLVEYGVPVTLNTDLPAHVCTTIGREYSVASLLGFSMAQLLDFTRNAVRASFTSQQRRAILMQELGEWEVVLPT